jgi:hypothetical protein
MLGMVERREENENLAIHNLIAKKAPSSSIIPQVFSRFTCFFILRQIESLDYRAESLRGGECWLPAHGPSLVILVLSLEKKKFWWGTKDSIGAYTTLQTYSKSHL